jgi:hypothetical protein
MIRPGVIIMDVRGRTMRLSLRCKIAGRKGWQAFPVVQGTVHYSKTCYVLDSEIKATKVPEGYQCFLA